MPLDVPEGTRVFLDANILYYHFVSVPPLSDPCTRLIERVVQGQVEAFTSTHLLAETMHKLMLATAVARHGMPRTSLVNWLQNHRDRIAEFTEFPQLAAELCAIPMTCLPVTIDTIREAAGLACRYALLTNDAIALAVMQAHGLSHLATNDDDFDQIDGLQVWKPR